VEGSRPATAADVPRIVELAHLMRGELGGLRGGPQWLAREARREPLADAYAALLDRPDALVVAGTYDGVIVGFGVVVVEPVEADEPLGVITDLFVEDEVREVGVGEAVVDALLGFCEAAGCSGVDASTLPGHRASKNFFETNGFTARLLVMHRASGRSR
jgi:ribosomal protein S18 acetylase RimI-like enzyme